VVPDQNQLMETTSAPLAAAQLIAATMSASELINPLCSILIGMMRQFHPTPAVPSPLLVAAEARLAQHVPWPKSSFGVLVPATTSRRWATDTYLAERSSWPRSQPVSTMAITTLALPSDKVQPCGAAIWVISHSCANSGSFGVVAIAEVS